LINRNAGTKLEEGRGGRTAEKKRQQGQFRGYLPSKETAGHGTSEESEIWRLGQGATGAMRGRDLTQGCAELNKRQKKHPPRNLWRSSKKKEGKR